MKSFYIVLMAFSLVVSTACAQVTERVKDINPYLFNTGIIPGSLGSVPNQVGIVNDRILFSADDSLHGRELWASDGTESGTILLRDINPLVYAPFFSSSRLGEKLSDSLYLFTAYTPELGWELWRTNATPEGTYLLKDIWPGDSSALPVNGAVPVNQYAFFLANDGVHGVEPWVSDGTESGTFLLRDINPGPGHCTRYIPNGTDHLWSILQFGADNKVFFSINRENDLYSFWVTDGTPEGTFMLKDSLLALPQTTVQMLGNRCFFYGKDPVNGVQLWASDGTVNGTSIVKKVSNTDAFSYVYFQPMMRIGGKLFFQLEETGYGYELWVTDGSAAGTFMLKDISPGPLNTIYSGCNPVVVRNKLYFTETGDGRDVLWSTDGTTAGTVQVETFEGRIPFITGLYDYLLIAQRVDDNIRLSRLDTCLASPIVIATLPRNGYEAAVLGKKQNRVYLIIENSNSSGIWVTDGTAEGTKACPFPGVTEEYPFFYAYYNFLPTPEYKNAFYYTAMYDFDTGYELYRVRDTTTVASQTPCNSFSAGSKNMLTEQLRVYPNPVTGSLSWQSDQQASWYVLTNATGQEVKNNRLTGSTIETGDLSPGLYVLRIGWPSGKQAITRFVKE